jgi:hypothetical protein
MKIMLVRICGLEKRNEGGAKEGVRRELLMARLKMTAFAISSWCIEDLGTHRNLPD